MKKCETVTWFDDFLVVMIWLILLALAFPLVFGIVSEAIRTARLVLPS